MAATRVYASRQAPLDVFLAPPVVEVGALTLLGIFVLLLLDFRSAQLPAAAP